jgi:predicted transcriptional regulator
MDTVQTTIRLDPALKGNLDELSRLRAVTLNRLVAQALEQFVVRESMALQQELRASLSRLERMTSQDPGFERAIDETAAVEAAMTADPAEGEVVLGQERAATSVVREILGG